jgi:hypothetical protein
LTRNSATLIGFIRDGAVRFDGRSARQEVIAAILHLDPNRHGSGFLRQWLWLSI